LRRYSLVLGYTIIYPSCSVRRPSVKPSTRGGDSDPATIRGGNSDQDSKEGGVQIGSKVEMKVEVDAAASGAHAPEDAAAVAAAAASASLEATNCTLNSVLVPEHLR
jgi:hypothetical protein